MVTSSLSDARWPGAVTAEDLAEQIRTLVQRADVSSVFYSRLLLEHICQGDVVKIDAGIPLLNPDGKPASSRNKTGLWLVTGNTCDFTRDLTACEWTQVVPIIDLAEGGRRPPNETAIRAYKTSRLFFVPPWTTDGQDQLLAADLTRSVHIHKNAFTKSVVQLMATMNQASWVLLNACLVRFCARDDRRFSPD